MSIDNKRLLDVLRRARDKISDPKHWARRVLARDRNNNEVYATSDKAYKYCAVGAITTITHTHAEYVEDYLRGVMREMYPNIHYLSEFNDSHKHAEVIALFDAAIAKLEAT